MLKVYIHSMKHISESILNTSRPIGSIAQNRSRRTGPASTPTELEARSPSLVPRPIPRVPAYNTEKLGICLGMRLGTPIYQSYRLMLVARHHDRTLILASVQQPLINSPWRSYDSQLRTLEFIARHLRESPGAFLSSAFSSLLPT